MKNLLFECRRECGHFLNDNVPSPSSHFFDVMKYLCTSLESLSRVRNFHTGEDDQGEGLFGLFTWHNVYVFG